MFSKWRTQNDSFIKAGFVMSEKIALYSKSFGEGEFTEECLIAAVNTIHSDEKKDFEQISFARCIVVLYIHN